MAHFVHRIRRRFRLLLVALGAAAVAGLSVPAPGQQTAQPTQDPFAPFEPLLGKTWRGEFEAVDGRPGAVDVIRWERALGGRAVRSLHSLNEGIYGGETLYVWNEGRGHFEYYYFTTAGFMTSGTMRVVDGALVGVEEVMGDASGITRVRSTSRVRADGAFVSTSEYFKNDEWIDGHSAVYSEAPDALIVLDDPIADRASRE